MPNILIIKCGAKPWVRDLLRRFLKASFAILSFSYKSRMYKEWQRSEEDRQLKSFERGKKINPFKELLECRVPRRMEKGLPHVKQRRISRGSVRSTDTCSLEFGEHGTDRKGGDSEHTERQESNRDKARMLQCVLRAKETARERELWNQLERNPDKGQVLLPHESLLQSANEGISKNPQMHTRSIREH